MTYLPTAVIGQWCFLYRILDLYRRKIVGFTVEATDHSDHAAHLLRRTALAEGLHALADKPGLHGDNGATLKATTVLAMLLWLGMKASYSRPRVSNDNAHAEALFRTAKYRPEFPAHGFATLAEARLWASDFVRWDNTEHRHSGLRYVTPAQRHDGHDQAVLAARQQLYQAARKGPSRPLERSYPQRDRCRPCHPQPRPEFSSNSFLQNPEKYANGSMSSGDN